jgi:lipoprotein signal peptidase
LHFKVEPIIDWPIFNIADSLLVCGAALMILHALRVEKNAKPIAATRQQ